MMKRILGCITLVIFIFTSYALAGDMVKKYEKELTAENKSLEKLNGEIKDIRGKIAKLKNEYVESDKKLRMDLISERKALLATQSSQDAHKQMITESKQKQEALRSDYYTKKKPLVQQLNKLKTAHRDSKRAAKRLEKKIKRIQDGHVDDEAYTNQMSALEDELAKAKSDYEREFMQLKDEVSDALEAIKDKEDKAESRKRILSDAKGKEVKLRQDYAAKKAGIKAEMDKAKKAHRELVRKNMEEKKREAAKNVNRAAATEKVKKSSGVANKSNASTNFGTR